MLKRRTFWIVALVLLLVVGVGVFLRQNNAAPTASEDTPAPAMELLPSDLTTVAPTDLRQILAMTGSLQAVSRAEVRARVSGQVQEVLVREGEAVKQGQLLIKMDVREYQARANQARGSLQAAQGQLDIARKTRANNKALLDKGFISKNAFDNAQSEYQIAQANVDSARGALDVALKSLGDTSIRSPIAGLVSSRSIEPGEKVSADNPLLEIVDLRQLELQAAVPAADIGRVAIGQEVRVAVEGIALPFTGKVVRVNPAIEAGSRSIMVYIAIDNSAGMLRAGMFGQAQLTLTRKDQVLTVPQAAVRSDAGGQYVYAIEGDLLLQQPVTLGIAGNDGEGNAIEVLDGLQAGTTIIRRNLGDLRSGTRVSIASSAGDS